MTEDTYSIAIRWSAPVTREAIRNDTWQISVNYSENGLKLLFVMCPAQELKGDDGNAWVVYAPPYLRRDLGKNWKDRYVIYDRIIEFVKNYDCDESATFRRKMRSRKFEFLKIDESYVHGELFILKKRIKAVSTKLGVYFPSRVIIILAFFGCMLSPIENSSYLVLFIAVMMLLAQALDFSKDLDNQKIVDNIIVARVAMGRPHKIKMNSVRKTLKHYWVRYTISAMLSFVLVLVTLSQS